MGKRGVSKTLSRAALALADGVFGTAVDMTLYLIAFMGTVSLPQSTSGQVWRAQREAETFLHEVNYDVIKHAIHTARKHRWLKRVKRGALPQITQEGKRRLSAVLPHYDALRVWDGHLHTVVYDIPETRREDRDLLRAYLRRIGCGRLQESVWMTPYNPIDILREFVREKELQGTVIVSDVGRDGAIGEDDIRGLIVRVYDLETLNGRYEEWFNKTEGRTMTHWDTITYLSILGDDPQLPFALLPPWWKGDEAYRQVSPYLLPFTEKGWAAS
ncbi:hypothetical protein HY411_03210 [Candidatus Gottesmanbacteria bacterium]|nr:hypothetical protein [Candidatus Gottesmanbacteria bacterium]